MFEDLVWKYKSVITFLVVGFIIFIFLVGTMFPPLWSLLSEPAPRAEITYGEFWFRFEYEINGEIVVVEDVVIVENDRTWNAGLGNHNIWPNRLASGNEVIELYRSETEVIFIRILQRLNGSYLLGGDVARENRLGVLPSVTFVDSNDVSSLNNWQREQVFSLFLPDVTPNWGSFGGVGWMIDTEDLFEIYGIRLISLEYDPPIINTFR